MVDLCSITGREGLFGHCTQTGFGAYPIFCLVGTRLPPSPHPAWVQKQDVESDCSSPEDLCDGARALMLPVRLHGLCLIVSFPHVVSLLVWRLAVRTSEAPAILLT
jgi:hypothetical protein